MIAHIDPGKHTGILVSFPRDLWVEIPGHGTAKINAAFAFGGPQLAITTIEQNFDIPISHYLEVDFAGFRDIVDAIGSVPIYFPDARARHEHRPGDHRRGLPATFRGEEALAYVRSRYYQYQTADGAVALRSDLRHRSYPPSAVLHAFAGEGRGARRSSRTSRS